MGTIGIRPGMQSLFEPEKPKKRPDNTRHRELCDIGARFLKNHINCNFRCQYVVVEFASLCNERPDVYGYRGGSHTVLIEVKVSRSDFLADAKKPHRKEGNGIGSNRYYLCPEGLIRIEELPEKWGLLYCDSTGRVTVIKQSDTFEVRDFKDEMSVMYSIIRRTNKAKVFNFKTD